MDTLQLIAEPRRREILALVWDRELPAGEIADHFDVTFGAISQHLARLREADLVVMRKDGNRRLYRADQENLVPYKAILEEMWTTSLRTLADVVEREENDA